VTVSRDTKAYVWKLDEGKREFELFYTGPDGNDSEDAFRIRACRYSRIEILFNIKIVLFLPLLHKTLPMTRVK
jgi:hypothetical protein